MANSPSTWQGFLQEFTDLREKAKTAFIAQHPAADPDEGEDDFYELCVSKMDAIRKDGLEKDPGFDPTLYISWHVLGYSSTTSEKTPYPDFEGTQSLRAFLTEIIDNAEKPTPHTPSKDDVSLPDPAVERVERRPSFMGRLFKGRLKL